MSGRLFYVQEGRGGVGNCASWWAKDCCGYTCNLAEAHVFTEEEIKTRRWRPTDVPLEKSDVDALAIQHVRVEALRRLGQGNDG